MQHRRCPATVRRLASARCRARLPDESTEPLRPSRVREASGAARRNRFQAGAPAPDAHSSRRCVREQFGARIKYSASQRSIDRRSCARIRAALASSGGDRRLGRRACADSVCDRISRRTRRAAGASLGARLRDRSGRGARRWRRQRRIDSRPSGPRTSLAAASRAAGSAHSTSFAKVASDARVPADAADRSGSDRARRRCRNGRNSEHARRAVIGREAIGDRRPPYE